MPSDEMPASGANGRYLKKQKENDRWNEIRRGTHIPEKRKKKCL